MKFNPSTVMVPKTMLSVNQLQIKKKLFALNNALHIVLFNFHPCKITPSVDKNYDFTFFSIDDIHFS